MMVTLYAYLQCFWICVALIRTVRMEQCCRKQKLDAPGGLATVVGNLAQK